MKGLRLVFNENEEYDYGINESYFVKNIHVQNKLFKMLPYTTTGKAKDYVTDFTGVVGEFVRILGKKKLSEKFDFKNFNNNLKEILRDSKDQDVILDIVHSLFIDNDALAIFDLRSFNYVKSSSSEAKIAQFIYTMLVDDRQKELYKHVTQQADMNVLHRLVYDALPELESKEYDNEDNNYICLLPYVKARFQEDFEYLLSNHELVEKYLKRVLEYYYLFYVTQLVIKLNKFEKADYEFVEKIYMTLSWEVTSQTRRSYEYGWQYVIENVERLFSHAITFELLAHNNQVEKLTYKNVYEEIIENQPLIDDIEVFLTKYKLNKSDVDFSGYRFDDSQMTDSKVTNKVKEMFQIIEYQFINSRRRDQNKRYFNNLVGFVNTNFGKWRGRLSYSFNITENDIIMFVQIILGQNEGRIRLVSMFNEFEKRGLLFDRESKSKIVELFEKLNLLEKKSDSGDAQYVRSIL